MESNIIEETKNKLVFELKGENHTFCNALRKELENIKGVEIAVYKIPHPLVGIPKFQIETKGIDSKKALKTVDLMIAECSFPSIGLGIELGWANALNLRIIIIQKKGIKVSQSLKAVSKELIEYESSEDLLNKLKSII